MRVLQGVTGQAGQPGAIAAGLRDIGIEAETCAIQEHKFGYNVDNYVSLSNPASLASVYSRIRHLTDRFDVFHFHARSFIHEWPRLQYPTGLDLLLLKTLGKKVFFHFRGSEIRLTEPFVRLNPFHYMDEPIGKGFNKKMPDKSKLRYRDMVGNLCDGVFVADEELATYVPNATVIRRALSERDWQFVGVEPNHKPLILHAPSRRAVKGTPAVLEAIDSLRCEGLEFEFKLIENMPHAEAVEHFRQCDIVIDQLRVGWYGVLATEAMALGKPAIAFIRDDLWETQQHKLPIINANPLTIKDRLREVILSQTMRQNLSIAGREYYLKYHAAKQIAMTLSEEYQREREPKPMDSLVKFMDIQMALEKGKSPKSVPVPKSKTRRRLETLADLYQARGASACVSAVASFIKRRATL